MYIYINIYIHTLIMNIHNLPGSARPAPGRKSRKEEVAIGRKWPPGVPTLSPRILPSGLFQHEQLATLR